MVTDTITYDGLPLDRYVSILEMLNPMHRFWSDGRWNKITLAHGCYWKKCSFCDVSLDYIGRYDKPGTDIVLRRIRALIDETGETGFHLVDEAAPPAGMKALAKKLLEEKLSITWWGNIRFEKTFTPELCQLLAESGCVAVSGGLEVASDRLLDLMKKGVTVEQVARVTRAFTDAGIMVHAYLMYGFPTETEQDTVDALERVRQLFAAGCIQSAYWHRFAATAHSPIGLQPEKYGITLHPPADIRFAHNDVEFRDPTGVDHDYLGAGLRKALYNYMHGIGLEEDVRVWFEPREPRASNGSNRKHGRGTAHHVPATDPNAPGIAELVRGAAGFGDIITRDQYSQVHLVATGAVGSDGAALAASPMLATVIEALAQTYDHVVIDAGSAADVPVECFAALAQRAVLVAASPGDPATRAARERMAMAGFADVTLVAGAGQAAAA